MNFWKTEATYFARGGWTGQIKLKPFTKLVFWRGQFQRREGEPQENRAADFARHRANHLPRHSVRRDTRLQERTPSQFGSIVIFSLRFQAILRVKRLKR
jgi:hypothetical protein